MENNCFDELIKNYFIYNLLNDEFNKWIFIENLIINKGIWLYKYFFYIYIYGEIKSECENFIRLLEEEKIIK